MMNANKTSEEVLNALKVCEGDDEDICCDSCAYRGEMNCIHKMTEDVRNIIKTCKQAFYVFDEMQHPRDEQEFSIRRDKLEALIKEIERFDAVYAWRNVEDPPKQTSDYLVSVMVYYSDGIIVREQRVANYNTFYGKWTVQKTNWLESISNPEYWAELPRDPEV